MNRTDAAAIVARLSGHFGIATDDVTARDWVNLVAHAELETGQATCESLITGWTRDRRPRPADWLEAVRGAALRASLERRPYDEIVGPGLKPVDRAEYQKRLAERREERNLQRSLNAPPWAPLRHDKGEVAPPLSHDEVYGP